MLHDIFTYLVYYIISWFILMQIFKLTTYHQYFKNSILLLFFWASLCGWVFNYLGLEKLFLWNVLIVSVHLYITHRKQKEIAASLINMQNEISKEIEVSYLKTSKYFVISSMIYVIVFSGSYIYFYNLRF